MTVHRGQRQVENSEHGVRSLPGLPAGRQAAGRYVVSRKQLAQEFLGLGIKKYAARLPCMSGR
jgi:hypothetical protein